MSRDGFTVNDVTGNDLDSRSAFSVKGQVLWTPDPNWEARVIVTGERARDGDYGLHDVAALRANPFHAARDFEGFADRDVFGTTIQVRRSGGPLVFSSTTGILKWTTRDLTDLDYTPQPLLQRDNAEEDLQFTQELRVASSEQAPIQLSDDVRLRWQAGVFFFTQGYEQDAVNSFSPFLVAPFPVSQHSPRSALDDNGVGLFGQATVTLGRAVRFLGRRALRSRVEGRRRSRRSTSRRSRRRRASMPRRASRASRRRCRRPGGCARSTRSTRRSAAASRRAGSTRRRRPAAKPTTRSRPGTSRAGSRRCGPAAASRPTPPSSTSTGTTSS